MLTLRSLTEKIISFRKDRDWEQFHNPKDLALSLSLEASEVLEHFQWKNGGEIDHYVKEHKLEIAEELSDVLYWVLLMSHDLDIDILDALDQKMKLNAKKYPVSKAKGTALKYNKL